ncbi:MAG: family 16 glycoside hydrolase [Rubripirellula sp.]
MQRTYLLFCFALVATPLFAETPSGTLILEDAFERTESDPAKEDVGNGWTTNSKSRAKGEKQVDLADGAMHITRAAVADHGVSVVHDLEFKDVTIQMKFKLGDKDSLGINIADMNEKSVHAGHLCLALVKRNKVEISDLKTGRMNQEVRTRRKDGKASDADKKLLKTKSKYFDVDLAADEWHQLQVQIAGETMKVSINGEKVGQFKSAGIGHPTKRRLRLAVAKSAWVDDVKVWQQ